MQAARDFVRIRIELSARVQLRHHDFGGGNALVRMNVNRNAASVIDYRDGIVFVDRDVDFGRIPSERLVY